MFSSVFVFIDGLPRLTGQAAAAQDLARKLRRFVLQRIGEQNPNDMSKIHMPLNGADGPDSSESVNRMSQIPEPLNLTSRDADSPLCAVKTTQPLKT